MWVVILSHLVLVFTYLKGKVKGIRHDRGRRKGGRDLLRKSFEEREQQPCVFSEKLHLKSIKSSRYSNDNKAQLELPILKCLSWEQKSIDCYYCYYFNMSDENGLFYSTQRECVFQVYSIVHVSPFTDDVYVRLECTV